MLSDDAVNDEVCLLYSKYRATRNLKTYRFTRTIKVVPSISCASEEYLLYIIFNYIA